VGGLDSGLTPVHRNDVISLLAKNNGPRLADGVVVVEDH